MVAALIAPGLIATAAFATVVIATFKAGLLMATLRAIFRAMFRAALMPTFESTFIARAVLAGRVLTPAFARGRALAGAACVRASIACVTCVATGAAGKARATAGTAIIPTLLATIWATFTGEAATCGAALLVLGLALFTLSLGGLNTLARA